MIDIRLKPGREKSVLKRHPWIFSGAVAEVRGHPADGETVRVTTSAGDFLAWGAYSSQSQIRVRIWSWDEAARIGSGFFRDLITDAISSRRGLVEDGQYAAWRVIHGESDGLPGVIVDRYAETLVVQYLSCGADYWRDDLAAILMEETKAASLYERSDADVRQIEGLAIRNELLRGNEPDRLIRINENRLWFWVDIRSGHKTGFYLDQRQNRLVVHNLSRDKHVLDCFSYTGGFSVNALTGGARSVTMVDESRQALDLARQNLSENGFLAGQVDLIEGNVFQMLRSFRDQGRKFDMIILDPPKFASTAAQAESASRGYKDINLLAFKLLNRGGLLITFSCSGGIGMELFQKIVAGAALDAGVDGKIVEYLHQSPDHPVRLSFPEGAYLKGLVVQVA